MGSNFHGYNELMQIGEYEDNNIYLNSFDFHYVIGKYYFGADKITRNNVDWPQYNPVGLVCHIGPTLVRTFYKKTLVF